MAVSPEGVPVTSAEIKSSDLTLYNWPTSTCSQKVRLVLAEKDLTWTDHRLDSRRNEHLSDWYLALNENGVVPTLMHGGRPIVDSSVITEYLDEVFPDPPLRPRDLYERARMRAWRQFIDEVPTPAIRVPSYNRYIRHRWKGIGQDEFDALVERRTVRKHFYRKMGVDGSDAVEEQEAIEKLRQTVLRMERALTSGPWLVGEQFTLADIALVPTLVRMTDIGLAHLWEDAPEVTGWFGRVQARPSFSTTFYPGSRYGSEGTHPSVMSAAC
jgi:glutathione S-transferase